MVRLGYVDTNPPRRHHSGTAQFHLARAASHGHEPVRQEGPTPATWSKASAEPSEETSNSRRLA
jgi:hypothetical protein